MEVIDLEEGDGDAHFLSLIEAAEAEALAKRQKVQEPAIEGFYTAALRGSRSSQWQEQQRKLKQPNNFQSAPAASNTGACFKCGMSGHWARDCGGDGGAWRSVGGGGGEASAEAEEKPCPCGLGTCLVLVSNTTKNPGRKFYRCPVREENGGCNFFEWCDSASSCAPPRNVSGYLSNPSVPELSCPCGAGPCLVLVTKSGKNVGQQYYRCPANEGRGPCGFFRWCNEENSASSQTASSLQSHSFHDNMGTQIPSGRSGSSCFKCGQEGHWARDCPKPQLDSNADTRSSCAAPSGSGTCFKCGQAGHWARNCRVQDDSDCKGSKRTSNAFRSSHAYK